jgi:hypothetical protein
MGFRICDLEMRYALSAAYPVIYAGPIGWIPWTAAAFGSRSELEAVYSSGSART